MRLDRDQLSDCIDRASLMAREGQEQPAKFSIRQDKLAITSNSEMGDVYEEMDVQTTGKDIDIAFNVRYISEAVRSIDETQFLLNLNSNISPACWCPPRVRISSIWCCPCARPSKTFSSAQKGAFLPPLFLYHDLFEELSMQVKKLSLDHFRNYESCVFEPGPGINLIVGENAQGKTNLLEAIFYCCFGRSHRTSRDKEMIAYDAPQALIRLESVRTDTLHELSVRLSQAEGRRIKADGLPLTRIGELMGLLNCVLFCAGAPFHRQGRPGGAAALLDMELSQTYPSYFFLFAAIHARAATAQHAAAQFARATGVDRHAAGVERTAGVAGLEADGVSRELLRAAFGAGRAEPRGDQRRAGAL